LRPKWRLPALDKTTAQEDEGMATRTSLCEIQLQQAVDKTGGADVKVMVDGKWAVSAHRGVLIARSRVFAGMLLNPTVEKETGVIRLEGVSVEGLVLFLEFVYLGMFLMCCQLWYTINMFHDVVKVLDGQKSPEDIEGRALERDDIVFF
jgi:hypothetical protein